MMPSIRRRMFLLAVAVGAAFLGTSDQTQAKYKMPDLEKIPVQQLVNNLEMLADRNPKDATIRLNLARAHAMAYALKTDTAQVNRWAKPEAGVWFGFSPKHVPFIAKEATDVAQKKAAAVHLGKAIRRYQETLQLAPENLTAQLGLAWCIEQSGKKDDAIRAYRQVVEEGWKLERELLGKPKEKKLKIPRKSVTIEAAGYLLPLLDKTRDAKEIEELQGISEQLKKIKRPMTPLVIPLRPGLGVNDLVDLTASVAFDADGSGFKHKWTWITKDAGWLVYDHQKTGKVDSALQLFGNVTFWMFWENGYRALSVLDRDQDGWLTGAELDGLAVWVDTNGNGVVDPGELKSLSELGIVSLSCRGQTSPTLKHTAAHAPVGVRFQDCSTRPTFDVLLYRR